MAKSRGRPEVTYDTIQARCEAETIAVLRKIAGLSGQGLPALMREWLLPIAKEELARRLKAEAKELGKDGRKKADD